MKSYFEVLILLIVIHSELLFIQDLPNLKKIYKMFPSIPKGCLKKPNIEVGILLGQNANALLPTGGTGEHQIDHLRVWRTILGEHGYILEGFHSDI